jgi:hypothetical protein
MNKKDDDTLDNVLDLKVKFQKPLLVGEQGPRPHTIYYIGEEGMYVHSYLFYSFLFYFLFSFY